MIDTIELIKSSLSVLEPLSIEVRDDSALHAGHAGAKGGGGHFHLTIVSDAFSGQRMIARHRLIYDTLGNLMQKRIHALAIRALSADEAGIQPKQKES